MVILFIVIMVLGVAVVAFSFRSTGGLDKDKGEFTLPQDDSKNTQDDFSLEDRQAREQQL
ncbi:MAG: hypothetical protein NC822_02495 [Candidatus Omnitrophica bacterium]|nr:hypothetical protein [Candidatus Omnitrophota bacterium]MCM8825963.1 hypothetical protein [Candidatus Omnitrophota bacterium]